MLETYTPDGETPKLVPLLQGGADVNALLRGMQMGVQKAMEEGGEAAPYDDEDDDDDEEDDVDEDDDEDGDDDEDDEFYDWDAADEEDSY